MSPRFEHLEHIDDDLSWEGLQAAAQDAIKPSRLSSGTVGKLVPDRELPSLKLYNIAPENGWLEDDCPFGKADFQGLC